MSALLDQFETEALPTLSEGARRSYPDSLNPLREYFVHERRNPAVDKVRSGHVQGYLAWRHMRRGDGRRGSVSNRTLAKDRAVLHRIFALATKMEYREGNPVADVDAPKSDGRTPVILSTEEYDRLIAACDERPMRGGDSHRTKTGKGRWVPMTPRLQRAMREHFARYRFATHKGEPTPWVFHHERTGRRHKAGARIQSMYAAYKSAARRADLSADFNQHDLRHRRVTTWLAEGKNPVHVKEAMGHADLATTMGYTHLAKEHLRSLG